MNDIETINATPHVMNIDGTIVEPSGILVRARQDNRVSGYRTVTGNDGKLHDVPIMITTYGDVCYEGDDAENIITRALMTVGSTVIVSLIAYNAMKEQGMKMNNVFIPTGQIRDTQGKVIGSLGIGRPV
jgi:hypothetical protein